MAEFDVVQLLLGFTLCYLLHSTVQKVVNRLKYWLFYLYEWIKRKRTLRTIPFDPNSDDARYFGIAPSPEVVLVEHPRSVEPCLNAIDGVEFGGVDSKGNALKLRFVRRTNGKANVWLYFITPDGVKYQLPHQPDSLLRAQDSSRAFSGAGLTLEVLEPLRLWRVIYSGFLKKVTPENKEDDVIVINFNFIWKPIYSHLAFPDDFSLSFKAKFLAQQQLNSSFKLLQFRCKENKLEQFGQLKGTIDFLNGQAPSELLLRGLKTRRHGEQVFDGVLSRFSIQGYVEEGTAFHIFGDISKDFRKNYIYGYVTPPSDMIIYHMTHCDFDAAHLLKQNFPSSQDIHLTITADGKEYRLKLKVNSDELRVYEGNDCDVVVQLWQIKIIMNGSYAGGGFIEVCKPSTDDNTMLKFRQWECLPQACDWEPDTRHFSALVVGLEDVECRSSKLVGGKASSLAKLGHLRRQGIKQFCVSPGLAVTNDAFNEFLRANSDVELAIRRVQNVAWKIDEGNGEEECGKLTALIEEARVSVELRNELSKRLVSTFGTEWEQLRFAIRSSALGVEDSEETSSAGQNETFLGVQGMNQICHSIVKCWSSQFAYRSVEYKRQNGSLLSEGMGVVVQQMVAAEVAGVLFTRDPVDGNPSRILITCNYGLGESVVSGVSDPDTIMLSRTYDGQVAIHSKSMGTKAVAILMDDSGGTLQREIDSLNAQRFSLTDEDALKLGELAITIEECFNGPRDIEWAIYNGEIYLLQVRPVTTGSATTDFEILHEFDSSLKTDYEKFTTANVGEVLPGYTHPLTFTTATRLMDCVAIRSLSWKSHTHRYDPVIEFIINSQYGRLLLNRVQQKAWDLSKVKKNSTKAFEIGIYGRVLDDEDIVQTAFYRYGRPHWMATIKFQKNLIKGMLFGRRLVENDYKKVFNLPTSFEGQNLEEVHEKILRHTIKLYETAYIHFCTTFASTIWNLVLFLFLAKGTNDFSIEIYQDFGMLISNCSGAESGNVPASLDELADEIGRDYPEFSKMEPKDALNWLQTSTQLCGKLFKEFLRRHGHRCRYEFDLGRIPWNEDELGLVIILQNLMKSRSQGKVKCQKEVQEDPYGQLHAKFSSLSKLLLRFIHNFCYKGVCNRELSKSLWIKYVDSIRKCYAHLGRLMVREGFIPEERLVFFLTNWEISLLLKTRSSTLIRRAKHRRRLYPYMEELKFPEMVDGAFVPATLDDDTSASDDGGAVVNGFPVCKGLVKARACVIKSFTECGQIRSGDILITHSTDIAWSPYFPLLSGVVTEIGGLVSHGAVVAREYGLPCIVGAFTATKAFKTGDVVILDAHKGIVRLACE